MDITKANRTKLNKFINPETVNYSVCYFSVAFLFLVLKQLFKIPFSAPVSNGVAAVISAAVLFVLEKKYVFSKSSRNKTLKEALLYVFRCCIDFGFYKIASYVFVTLVKQSSALTYFLIFFIYLFFNYYFDRLLVFDCVNKPAEDEGGVLFKRFYSNRYVFASMLLAFICFSFIFTVFTLFPFGDLTVLRMDLYHQYGPLFCELYDRVTHFKSFLYSWNSGGGSSFLGNYFNYLSSPLSAVILLFDRKYMPYAITTLVMLKGILSAGAFTYYVKCSLKRHSLAAASFGVFYAFCSYFLAYYWNIMWIDSMFLLPFILLGIERIINEGKPKTYIISLVVMLYSSYYIGFMICIFSVIYFFAYYALAEKNGSLLDPEAQFKRYSFKKYMNLRFVNRLVTFGASSALCGALCAAVLIPVYFILQSCSATSDSAPTTFESYFDLLNLITSHLAGLETTIRSSGEDVLPNVYCGVMSLILLPLYIINKDIRIKEKAVYVALILFFVFSFDNNWVNFIWHAFHFPNDLPYRFSFMYSFIILVIGFRSLMHFKAIEYKDIAYVGLLWIFAILILQKYQTNKMSEFVIYLNIAFIICWTAVFLMIKKGNAQKLMLGLTIFAMTFCEVLVADMNSFVFSQYAKDYLSHYESYTEAIHRTTDKDKGFYRMELTELDTRMDTCLYGYNGMSTFSSMAYEDYSQNQFSLGLAGNRINSYTYASQTPVYNMMFNVKYVMQAEESSDLSEDFYSYAFPVEDKKTTIYENKYNLPIAFLTSGDLKKWKVEEGDPFVAQSDFIEKAAGVTDIFREAKIVDSSSDDVSIDDVTSNGTYYYTKDDPDSNTGSIDVEIEAQNNSNLYVYITSPQIENVNYSWKGKDDSVYQNIDEPGIIDLGKHNKGDIITASLECGSTESDTSYFEIYAYNIDKDVFESSYELLKQGELNVTSYSDTKIEGTLNAGYNGTLYTSVPYDKGWSVYVDGKHVKTYKIAKCQLGCDIAQGEHKIVMKYTPRGLKLGLSITLVSYLLLALWCFRKKLRFSKKDTPIVENV